MAEPHTIAGGLASSVPERDPSSVQEMAFMAMMGSSSHFSELTEGHVWYPNIYIRERSIVDVKNRAVSKQMRSGACARSQRRRGRLLECMFG